jgi:serine/threonine protein kinase
MIGIQILDRLEYIHNKNIIHRDVKPDNFVIGNNDDKNNIYMIDFGLAKRYRNPLTQEHIPFKLTRRLTGTARYASVNALKGGEQSRKDDLESLNYMLLYFLKGSLPWQGVLGLTKGEKYKKIYHMKKNISAEKLYENLPNEFKEIYLYIKKLEFEQDPDYEYCRKLLNDIIENNCGEICDYYFTWCKEINIGNKNFFFSNANINKGSNNYDESGKTQKSTNIINICNSNILFDKVNNKKIKKISVTFVDKRKKSYLNVIFQIDPQFSILKVTAKEIDGKNQKSVEITREKRDQAKIKEMIGIEVERKKLEKIKEEEKKN